MSLKTDTEALATAPIGSLLLSYSIPAILASIVSALSSLIGAFFVGHGVGGFAIPALAVTFPVFTIVMAVGLMLGVGGSSLMSISLGRNDTDTAFKILGNLTVLSILIFIPLSILLYTFLDPLLILFGASEDTLPLARDYMLPFTCSLLAICPMLTLAGLMRCSGYPQKSLLVASVSITTTVISGPILIFYFDLGMRGASFMSILGIFSGSILCISHFLQKKHLIHYKKGIYKIDLNIIKSILKIGTPSFLINACACFIVMLINQILSKYGGDAAIGAYGILSRVSMLFLMTVAGLGQGMQPIIGFNFGAKNLDRIFKTMKYGIVIAFTAGSIGFTLIHLFPESFVYIFSPDPALFSISIRALKISTLMLPLMSLQVIFTGFFIALGVAGIATILSLSRQVIFLLPLLLILPNIWGTDGVWIGIAMADFISFCFALTIYLWYRKKLTKNF